jgi:hypothetical protein
METLKALSLAALVAVFLSLAGCSALERIGDFASDNPLIVSAATRQAVGRYIARGETPEAEARRAEAVEKRVNKALAYLDGDPDATINGLFELLENSIDWAELTTADRILVRDVMSLVRAELDDAIGESDSLTPETRLAFRDLLETAASAAAWYK